MDFSRDDGVEPAGRWLGLRWSAWMPLVAAHPLALAQLPSERGLYRIRRAGVQGKLEWIGWAENGVRERVERLSRQVHMPVRPYESADGPALALWELRRARGAAFEVSGAAVVEGDGESWLERARAGHNSPS
jgi:hypothetical protein